MNRLNSKASAEDARHRELLAASATGCRESFAQLYDLLYHPVVRFLYRYTSNSATIEEILNDTMLVLWQKADTFRGDSRLMTWVLGIASRRALKTVNRERSQRERAAQLDPPELAAQDLERLGTLATLEWAMQQLSADHQLVLEMAYFQGLSCEEMAEVLGCPVNTAKTRLHYGRNKLRAVFAGEDNPLELNDFIDEASR
ncbi:RNA polymerase sigma factor [Mangrovimicrobium sediminis]|uniref:RNA polymerase sigma factor n=1 Tax=Mangrovimicrobium sediminis TaxID=2562682 RepID=A0A4Z0M9B5_9GAMM|nr:RNA polymerase sigma factor [Haliea sp. SAOS-164]TGD75976.1 RNA polymerase sigma factor [Haliea sp. SAOS-164]